MADVEQTARTALGEIREAIGGYRSRGLTAEIDAARRTLDAAGVKLLAESKAAHGSFSPQEETALALAVREAVTNIVRHARATNCRSVSSQKPAFAGWSSKTMGRTPWSTKAMVYEACVNALNHSEAASRWSAALHNRAVPSHHRAPVP